MIKLYTQASCPQCKMVHMLLDKKHIEYEEEIITPDTINKYIEQGISHTPTLVVDGKQLCGKEIITWINSK